MFAYIYDIFVVNINVYVKTTLNEFLNAFNDVKNQSV